jgi:hypothetical protein
MNRHFKPSSVGVLLTQNELWDLIEMVDQFIDRYKADDDYTQDLKKVRTKLIEAEKIYL